MNEHKTRLRISMAAEQLALELADRLRNALPTWLEGRVRLTDRYETNTHSATWQRATLNGHAGIAILFAHLGHRSGTPDPSTHDYLREAVTALQATAQPRGSLYYGIPAVALAAATAAQEPAHYSNLLSSLDQAIASAVERTAASSRQHRTTAHAGTTPSAYDAISGLSGVGRYTLARGERMRSSTKTVLESLVKLTEPVMVDNRPTPGWWIADPPPSSHLNRFTNGYFDLGIAHGIAGPLALLSLAALRGFTVSGQTSAIERIVDWLLLWTLTDEHGPYWPTIVSLEEERGQAPRPESRSRGGAWCYGSPGIARALQLASQALTRPQWEQTAIAATRAVFDRASDMDTLYDAGLCHGWAGLLQPLLRITEDSDDQNLQSHIPELTERIIEQYDPALPYGYRHYDLEPRPFDDLDDAGYLTGTTGIALTLLNVADLT
ncbi:lanthionine synthetase C family protein, partial [Kitasatospora sp. SUK 42]|uniref:lanthionine synthetase C family protein n=1 Tax=Kitasatospora sp. SUK 42 TaxID=1588882 RepID=UPI001C31BBFF